MHSGFRAASQRPPLFGLGNRRSEPCDRKGDLVLHGEDIGQIAVVAFCPDMVPGLASMSCAVDADPVTARRTLPSRT